MPDRKPPQLDQDESTTVLALLQYQRESLVRKVSGVDEHAARRSPVGSGTTLLWLVKHMAQAESLWVLRRFAGLDGATPDDSVTPDDTVAAAVSAYQEGWQRIDTVVRDHQSLDDPCRGLGDAPAVNLRWVLMHLLEETARHAGHADILRELIDGETGR